MPAMSSAEGGNSDNREANHAVPCIANIHFVIHMWEGTFSISKAIGEREIGLIHTRTQVIKSYGRHGVRNMTSLPDASATTPLQRYSVLSATHVFLSRATHLTMPSVLSGSVGSTRDVRNRNSSVRQGRPYATPGIAGAAEAVWGERNG